MGQRFEVAWTQIDGRKRWGWQMSVFEDPAYLGPSWQEASVVKRKLGELRIVHLCESEGVIVTRRIAHQFWIFGSLHLPLSRQRLPYAS